MDGQGQRRMKLLQTATEWPDDCTKADRTILRQRRVGDGDLYLLSDGQKVLVSAALKAVMGEEAARQWAFSRVR
jgi:hypothetical protein